jgi:VWFA-related protein
VRRRYGIALGVLLLLLGAGSASLRIHAQDAQPRRGFSISITEPANQQVIFGKTRIAATVKIECSHDFGEEQRSWIIRVIAHHAEGVTVSDAIITRKLKFSTIEQVNRVILWVSAKDKDGRFITDLAKEDFKILEDGREQRVIDFYKETRPITMAILLDTSGSMRGEKIAAVHLAAVAFVESLRPIDSALVIDFDDNVFLIQPLTSDHEPLQESITSTEAIGGTAMYDALHAAYRKIGEIEGRKVIVLLSDGADTTSQFGHRRVLEEAKTNNTMIFSIGLSGDGGGADKSVLQEFSDVSGGRFFAVRKPDQLPEAYKNIAEELGNQFYISYSTSNDNWDGHWVKLKVESKRPGIKISHRSGYFAVRTGAAVD